MTRFLVFGFILIGLGPLWSQADMTRNDLYMAGDTADFYAVDATDAEPGPAGIGVTWDFSHLDRIPEEDFTVFYEDVSAAPNAGQFPEANLVAIQDAGPINAYTFFSVSDQRFILEGLDLPDLGVVTYSDKNLWVEFPFSYNETETDDFVGTYVFNIQGISGIANRTGSLTTHYDGFGTLILPDGTRVENVRRLKLDQVVEDVVNVSGFSVVTRVETTTYHFQPEGDRMEVFQLTLADTTVTPPGMTIASKVASYRKSGGGMATLAGRRGAHLTAQGGDFNSEILIRNPTDGDQMVDLIPLDGDGGALAGVEVLVPAGGTSRVGAEDYFSAEAQSFSISGCNECTTSVGYRAALPDASTAQVHETGKFDTEFSFYPGEWGTLFDGVAVVNAGGENGAIDAHQVDDDGTILDTVRLIDDLAPGAKHLTIFNNLFAETPNTIIKLTSDQPMAVMILRISSDGRYLYQNLPMPDAPEPGDSRWLAHITSETGGFDTDIYLHNYHDDPKTVALQSFTSSGEVLDVAQVTVAGNGTRRFAKTDLFDGDATHASISGDPDVIVTLGYRARVEDASTAAIHEGSPVGTVFDVYPGEWDLLFDGFALVNTGDEAAKITVTQIGDDGTERTTVTLEESLAAKAKYLGLLEGLIPEDADTVIRIESTQPLAVLALRLSKDGRFLYNNNPLP